MTPRHPRRRRPARGGARGQRRPVMLGQGIADPVEDGQAGGRAVDHRRRDRPVDRHDRIAGHPLEDPVQRGDLRPVGVRGRRRRVVEGGDRRLQLVLADAPSRRSPGRAGRCPRAIRARSQRDRSCSASGTSSPRSSVRAGRRASSSSIRASSPCDLGFARPLRVRASGSAGSPRPPGRRAGVGHRCSPRSPR